MKIKKNCDNDMFIFKIGQSTVVTRFKMLNKLFKNGAYITSLINKLNAVLRAVHY